MPKAPKMVIMALVLSLLALPAFGLRREGLERISFSSQPLNLLDHRPAGLIEVGAGTGGRETENEDECDKELRSLEKNFTETCERHDPDGTQGWWWCRTTAKNTIRHRSRYPWQHHLATKVLKQGKTPVFWAGFWPGGEEGIDTREALADFISSVNGFQLADTEWGQAAESDGANNLEACTWDRKKNWWNAASINMAEAMALHNVTKITIALHKRLTGDVHSQYPFYKTILYQAELPNMGYEMSKKLTWNPEFHVHSIAVKRAPLDESGCALASAIRYQLELEAQRPVTVWCRPCTTLQACGPKQLVEKNSIRGKCIYRNCEKGLGFMTWEDGSQYTGDWKKGKMHGKGNYAYACGAEYVGYWKKGLREGNGTYTLTNGDKYQGQWKNGFPDGQGTYTFENGDIYQGDWNKGEMHGKGTYTHPNGEKYEFSYKEGRLTKKVKKT